MRNALRSLTIEGIRLSKKAQKAKAGAGGVGFLLEKGRLSRLGCDFMAWRSWLSQNRRHHSLECS